jgi:aminoglycoside 6'-N-acetyltransferase I
MLTVRPVRAADADAWAALRAALWPESGLAEHRAEVAAFLEGHSPRQPCAVFVAESAERLIGFAEVSVRPFAEGCESAHVGYLEGWFVSAEARRRGVGRALGEAAAGWARAQGCTEFASDAHPDNELSRRAHVAVGFADVGLVRCFAQKL